MRTKMEAGVTPRLIGTWKANRLCKGRAYARLAPSTNQDLGSRVARSHTSLSPRGGARTFLRSESERKARPGARSRRPIIELGSSSSAPYPTTFETRPPIAGKEVVGRACLPPNGRWRRQLRTPRRGLPEMQVGTERAPETGAGAQAGRAAAFGRIPAPRGRLHCPAPFSDEWRASHPIRGGGAVNIPDLEGKLPNGSIGAELHLREGGGGGVREWGCRSGGGEPGRQSRG